MTIAEFWSAQHFSYLVTYSFNRGPKLAALHEATTAAIKQTEQELRQAPVRNQRKLEYQLRKLQEDIDNSLYNKKITTNSFEFNSTAKRIAVVRQDSVAASQLSDMFQASTGEAVFFMCLPIYRDALVFYNEHDKPLCVLNICLECLFMETGNGLVVEADVPTYEAFQKLLIYLGRPVEGHEG